MTIHHRMAIRGHQLRAQTDMAQMLRKPQRSHLDGARVFGLSAYAMEVCDKLLAKSAWHAAQDIITESAQ